jgi:hypothetical protein
LTVKPETVKQGTSPVQKKEVPSACDSSKASEGSLSQVELAKRLGVDTSNVGRTWKKKGEEGFRIWSKEKDPKSIAWRRCEKTGRYLTAE